MNTNLKKKKIVGLSSLTLVSMLGILAASGCGTDTPSSSSTQPTTSTGSSSSTSATQKVMSLSSKLLNEFKVNSSEQTNKEEEFIIRDQMLKVGDDNQFNFRIDAYSVDDLAEPIRIENPATNVKVEQLVGGTYQELSSLDNVVTIDEETTSFDFDELSIGKQFKITVEAKDILSGYNEDDCKFEAELLVVDGFNVYDEDELSIFNNSTTNGWEELKEENDLSQYTDSVKALIIQKDLFLKSENIPASQKWQKTDADYANAQLATDLDLEGALIDPRDDRGIYTRWGERGEEFLVSGNYFGISAQDVPSVLVERNLQNGIKVEEGKENFINSHAKLFSFYPEGEGEDIATVKFENMSVIGNSALNSDPINSGGLTMLRSNLYGSHLQIENVISNNAYTGYFTSRATAHILNSKVYNTFNSAIFAWGSEDFLIENSTLIGSGGPLMAADHGGMQNEDKTTGSIPNINVINSKLESKVSGLEPWFVDYNATAIAAQLKQLELLFDGSMLPPTGKTIIADTFEGVDRINVLCLIKGDGEDITELTRDIDGSMHMFDTKEQYNKFYGLEGEVEDKTVNYGLDLEGTVAAKAWANKDNYVESNFNGGYINSGIASYKGVDTSDQATFQTIGFANILGWGETLPGFANNLPYEQMRVIVDGAINSIPSTDKMNLVYDALVGYNFMPTIDNFKSFPLESQKMALISVLDQTKAISKSYADGDYLNIYVANGMGVMVQLYDVVE